MAEGAGLNLYAYVANNPINAVDPNGDMSPLMFWGGLALLAALVIGPIAYYDLKTDGKIQDVNATPVDMLSMEKSISTAADKIQANLDANPQCHDDIYKGTIIIGQRGVFGGSLTQAGYQLTVGQQAIVNYLENAREFNLKPDAYQRLDLLQTFGTLQGEIENANDEVKRLRLAVLVLQNESARRSGKN